MSDETDEQPEKKRKTWVIQRSVEMSGGDTAPIVAELLVHHIKHLRESAQMGCEAEDIEPYPDGEYITITLAQYGSKEET